MGIVKHDWVGLRPYRNAVRLEKEVMHFDNQSVNLVHNYGHGGSGVTTHWGCALAAAGLVQEAINALPDSK